MIYKLIQNQSIGKELSLRKKYSNHNDETTFIIVGPDRIYKHLQQMGYQTYNHLFDNVELFDTEKNLLQKIDILIDNLEVLYIKKDNSAIWDNII